MPYLILRSDFITVLLRNNLAMLQLFVIILNCVRISDRPQQAQDVNAVLLLEKRQAMWVCPLHPVRVLQSANTQGLWRTNDKLERFCFLT